MVVLLCNLCYIIDGVRNSLFSRAKNGVPCYSDHNNLAMVTILIRFRHFVPINQYHDVLLIMALRVGLTQHVCMRAMYVHGTHIDRKL